MPQQPLAVLFDPDRSIQQLGSARTTAVELLGRLRQHGLGVLSRCPGEQGFPDEKVALLVFYNQLLEMLDATSVLIDQVALVPARLQVRAMFEALISLEYILS